MCRPEEWFGDTPEQIIKMDLLCEFYADKYEDEIYYTNRHYGKRITFSAVEKSIESCVST